MIEEQKIIPIEPQELVAKVAECLKGGYRLVQIGCAQLGGIFEINYSFDKNASFLNFKLSLPTKNAKVPSVSSVYFCAFLYENEIHDLYGITFEGLALDYKGTFYRTAAKTPFLNPVTPPPAAPAPEKAGAQ